MQPPPEALLDHWQDWGLPCSHKPVLLRRFDAGLTNRSYLMEGDKHLWVLRINTDNTTVPGIDRQREKLILEQASAAGLAPEIKYCSVEHGLLVSEYIEGRHWHPEQLQDQAKLSLLLDALGRIHSLPVSTTPIDYQQHAEACWQQMLYRNITIPDDLYRQRERVDQVLQCIPVANAVCHHDPIPANIVVRSDRLYFLDWEYAAPGWPTFDYAALASEWDIPPGKLTIAAGVNVEEIEQAGELYDYLCKLWSKLR